MTARRQVLRLLGGSVVLAAAGGTAWTVTRDPEAARAPWRLAGGADTDPRLRWLSWAILAPNPHNRQPWLVDLREPGAITLRVDLDRRLPDTDPFDRQITIGLGGFLELLRMAAAQDGVALAVRPFPEGWAPEALDGRPVAHVRIAGDGATPDPLFALARDRRTSRRPFDVARPVPEAVLARVAAAAAPLAVGLASAPAEVERLRDVAWRAMLAEMHAPTPAMESIELTRIGRAEVEANPDGISLFGPMIEGLALAGLMRREDMADPASAGFAAQVDALRPQFETAMAFLWIATEGNGREAQLAAGRAYMRANLAATAEGVAMQPFSQGLQEYPEMAGIRAEMEAALAPEPGRRVQMLARLGYAPAMPGSPRWPLGTRILPA